MRVIFLASEAEPFARTGGLGDVASSLPAALSDLGVETAVIIPFYNTFIKDRDIVQTGLKVEVSIGETVKEARLLKASSPALSHEVYFVECPSFFDRRGIYGEGGSDYSDNAQRFSFFSRAAVEFACKIFNNIDIIHLNDWHTCPAAMSLMDNKNALSALKDTGVLLTIHNLAYQGIFDVSVFPLLGLSDRWLSESGAKAGETINFLKGGINACDFINTVSPSYAEEICTPEFGCGLEEVLSSKKDRLCGILNGIDENRWNPETDGFLPSNYSICDISGKAECKHALQAEFGLQVEPSIPLFGVVSRLCHQKGTDIIPAALEPFLRDEKIQFIGLGTGDPEHESMFLNLASRYSKRVGVKIEFSERTAHLIEGGCDFFIMPSRFEPCGLNQMYSLRYGTVPIVSPVGGLKDTVIDIESSEEGNGFVMKSVSSEALEEAVLRAISMYVSNPSLTTEIRRRGMAGDYGWQRGAQRYIELYEKLKKSN